MMLSVTSIKLSIRRKASSIFSLTFCGVDEIVGSEVFVVLSEEMTVLVSCMIVVVVEVASVVVMSTNVEVELNDLMIGSGRLTIAPPVMSECTWSLTQASTWPGLPGKLPSPIQEGKQWLRSGCSVRNCG